MNIAIDITPLRSDHRARGTGVYTQLLIKALQKYEVQHSYSFFTRVQDIPQNTDIVHYPFFDPFFLTLPLRKRKPTVVTVHDLIPLAFPSHFKPGIRGEVKWHIQRLSLQGARVVITDSYASKRDIMRLATIPLARLCVIPLAPSPNFQPVAKSIVLHSAKEKYKLPEWFLVYVGDVNWNKNVIGMLRAFRNIKYQIFPRQGSGQANIKDTHSASSGQAYKKSKIEKLKLILVGEAFLQESAESREINTFITEARLDAEVFKLGFVPEKDLVAIYNLASVYVQPSFAEGFGLPILEAMACGCPVVCSSRSSLAEIAGPARLVDPENPSAMAEAILAVVVLVPTERKQLIDKGFSWVKQFSWQRVARETVAAYEAIFQK